MGEPGWQAYRRPPAARRLDPRSEQEGVVARCASGGGAEAGAWAWLFLALVAQRLVRIPPEARSARSLRQQLVPDPQLFGLHGSGGSSGNKQLGHAADNAWSRFGQGLLGRNFGKLARILIESSGDGAAGSREPSLHAALPQPKIHSLRNSSRLLVLRHHTDPTRSVLIRRTLLPAQGPKRSLRTFTRAIKQR